MLAWFANIDGELGTWVQPIAPTLGTKVLAPRSATDGKALVAPQRIPVVVRAGTNDFSVAYCSGYPICTEALIWEVGAPAPIVGRTNDDATEVGAEVVLQPPQQASVVKIFVGKKTVTTNRSGRATARRARGVTEVTKAGYSPAVVLLG